MTRKANRALLLTGTSDFWTGPAEASTIRGGKYSHAAALEAGLLCDKRSHRSETNTMTVAPAQLAVLGAPARFPEPLHVGRPNIPDMARVLARFQGVLERRWLTNDGPEVREFERRICEFIGVKHCVAMCNATVALEIAIRALGLRGEVIVPSFTFIATAHALRWQEITPVFADIAPQGHNIDPARIERQITPRTTGIIATHIWGRACAIEALQDIADRHGLTLLFDAAHAFGCTYRGRKIGSFGQAEVFSFHATKFLNSAEGGAVVTNDDELATRLRFMRNFGFAGYDRVAYLGTNGKMNELSAALGLCSLDYRETIVEVNRRNLESYRRCFAEIPGVEIEAYASEEQHNYQYVVTEISPEAGGLTRDELMTVLHRENVLARRYFWPGCHRQEPYRTANPDAGQFLPETERVSGRVLLFPTGTSITHQEIETIAEIVRTAVEHAPEVRSALAESA